MEYDYIFKIIIIGEANVGKTCILERFVENNFNYNQIASIGIENKSKILNIDQNTIKLNVWDTAGSEVYKGITRNYYKSTIGVIITYDITNMDSFKKAEYWLNEYFENGNEDAEIMLIGNKKDLNEYRRVSRQEGESFSKKYNWHFSEVSAKESISIKESFEFLSKCIIEKIESNKIIIKREDWGIRLGSNKKIYYKGKSKESNNCCI